MSAPTPAAHPTGKVVQILGNVVDVEFPAEALPRINDALKVDVNADRAQKQGRANGLATKIDPLDK